MFTRETGEKDLSPWRNRRAKPEPTNQNTENSIRNNKNGT